MARLAVLPRDRTDRPFRKDKIRWLNVGRFVKGEHDGPTRRIDDLIECWKPDAGSRQQRHSLGRMHCQNQMVKRYVINTSLVGTCMLDSHAPAPQPEGKRMNLRGTAHVERRRHRTQRRIHRGNANETIIARPRGDKLFLLPTRKQRAQPVAIIFKERCTVIEGKSAGLTRSNPTAGPTPFIE